MMTPYRLGMALALPALLARTAWAERRGGLPEGALAERRGAAAAPAHVWLHGASLGEVASARPLVAALLAGRPWLRIAVTCNTPTARAAVRGWGLPAVTAALAPLDAAGPVLRFLDGCQPALALQIEGEFWPERLEECRAQRIPVVVLGARISRRTADRWRRLAPGLMRRMLGSVHRLSAQDAASEARFLALGLPPARLAPRHMLKAQVAGAAPAAPFAPPAPRPRCLLAASTHEGDEGPILDAFARLREAGRFAHLILAPRHPQRGEAVAALAVSRGLGVARRSQGQVPGPGCDVHVADTTGEMASWYAMAGVTVIGGTFGTLGGHTPFEPAAQGSAIVHGPDVANFAEAFAALDRAGGAVAVPDARALAGALAALDEAAQGRLAAAAAAALAAQPLPPALLQAITALLPSSG